MIQTGIIQQNLLDTILTIPQQIQPVFPSEISQGFRFRDVYKDFSSISLLL